jgi:hypothetical protein
MRWLMALACAALLAAAPATAHAGQSNADRIQDLQDELDSLTEDIEDLQEPVEEFELFDECAYAIGVTERSGYLFGNGHSRPALALDIRGFGRAQFSFLAFPAEEPPSIECNEDAGAEDSDD